MPDERLDSFIALAWDDVREDVEYINPEFSGIIDKLSPSKKFKIFKAKYKFGEMIVEDGNLRLPTSSSSQSDKFKELLSYSQIPLSLLLDKNSEVFITESDRVIPLKFFCPGEFFGLFETLNMMFKISRTQNWNVSAGGRSIFTIPKISKNLGLKRLRQSFGLSIDADAHSLGAQWNLFKEISRHRDFQDPWSSHVLFFSEEWFQYKKKDPAWIEFHHYLYKTAWIQFQQFLSRDLVAANWKNFIKAISGRRLRPTAYIADTFRHLLLIAIGEAPAFIPSTNNLTAPIQGLQNAIIEVYKLDKYFPTIMQPVLPVNGNKKYVYYSMAFPTLLEGTPDSKNNTSTIMFDLKMIKVLVDTLKKDEMSKTSFFKDIEFDYFHVEQDVHNEIKQSSLILSDDRSFLAGANSPLNNEFCSTGAFFRGCIRMII